MTTAAARPTIQQLAGDPEVQALLAKMRREPALPESVVRSTAKVSCGPRKSERKRPAVFRVSNRATKLSALTMRLDALKSRTGSLERKLAFLLSEMDKIKGQLVVILAEESR